MVILRKMSFVSLILAGTFTTASALAVQKDINVTAIVDPDLQVTKSDGTPLPTEVTLDYLPGRGLNAYKEQIKFWSNAEGKDLKVRLASDAVITDESGKNQIPLSVSVNGKVLTTADTIMSYAETFPAGIESGSSNFPFSIYQTSVSAIPTGTYTGTVGLVVLQSTTSSGA